MSVSSILEVYGLLLLGRAEAESEQKSDGVMDW
jgi:hypothetical protein